MFPVVNKSKLLLDLNLLTHFNGKSGSIQSSSAWKSKMKYFGLFLITFALLVSIECWMAISPYNRKEFRENKITDAHCFTASMGKFKKGEEKPLNNTCGVAICSDTRYISLMGCGVMGTTPPCYIAPGNLSKPYPHCCDILVCPHSPDE
ncbi:hypothetical protein D910_12384 [Dendroctonus ponderosae]